MYCPDSMCQGPEAGKSLGCFRTVRKAGGSGVLGARDGGQHEVKPGASLGRARGARWGFGFYSACDGK